MRPPLAQCLLADTSAPAQALCRASIRESLEAAAGYLLRQRLGQCCFASLKSPGLPSGFSSGRSRSCPLCRVSSSQANSLQDPAADANGSVSSGAVFAARDNPRAFFVREPLPSTEGPMASSLGPSHLTPRASQEDQATSDGEQFSTQPRGLPRPANGAANGAGPSTARESPSEQVD